MLNEVEHHVPAARQIPHGTPNTPSGIINLKTGAIREHNPDYYFTKSRLLTALQTQTVLDGLLSLMTFLILTKT